MWIRGLLLKVLQARYGLKGGRVWSKDIMGVRRCVEVEVDNLFDDNLVRAMNNEANNLF